MCRVKSDVRNTTTSNFEDVASNSDDDVRLELAQYSINALVRAPILY